MAQESGKRYTDPMKIGGIGNGNIPPSGGSGGPPPSGGPGGDGPKKTEGTKHAERDEFVKTPDSVQLEWLEEMGRVYGPSGANRFIATPEATFQYLAASAELTPEQRVRARALYERWKIQSRVRHSLEPIQPIEPIAKTGDREPEVPLPESPDDGEGNGAAKPDA